MNKPTINTKYQRRLSLFFISMILRQIFIEKVIAGTAIRSVDRNRDATSGPKINLPPQKNFCKAKKRDHQREYAILLLNLQLYCNSTTCI